MEQESGSCCGGACAVLFHIGSNLQYIFLRNFPQQGNSAMNTAGGVPYEVEFRRYFKNRFGVLNRV